MASEKQIEAARTLRDMLATEVAQCYDKNALRTATALCNEPAWKFLERIIQGREIITPSAFQD